MPWRDRPYQPQPATLGDYVRIWPSGYFYRSTPVRGMRHHALVRRLDYSCILLHLGSYRWSLRLVDKCLDPIVFTVIHNPIVCIKLYHSAPYPSGDACRIFPDTSHNLIHDYSVNMPGQPCAAYRHTISQSLKEPKKPPATPPFCLDYAWLPHELLEGKKP
jgi:hypothetical protein